MAEAFIEEYASIKGNNLFSIREHARNVALNLLSSGLKFTSGFERYLTKPRVQFLYIHHVFKDEEKPLARLLKALAKHHSFIPYNEAWKRILNGTIDKPYIAFSSDDGLKNNLRAASIFSEFGATACFFICPSIIDESDFQKISKFSSERLHFPAVEFMTWKDIDTLQKLGHEIGSHTISHINIAESNKQLLLGEIGDAKTTLEKYCGEVLHFAYPYGRHFHFSEAGKEAVFRSGYLSCASAERGCHITESDGIRNIEKLLIRRDHILLDWNLDHILFFLTRNAMNASVDNNNFPAYEDSDTNQHP